jgi:serine protease Do
MLRKTIYLGLFLILAAQQAAAVDLPAFTDLAEDAGKAVVNISTVKTVQKGRGFHDMMPFHRQGPFEDFFDQFDKYFKNDPTPRKQNSLGSGFIISPRGFIVTNNHVIADADEVQVNLQGSDQAVEATIIGRDPETDLALLKIDVDRELPSLRFGDSSQSKVGSWVMAIGNPFGLSHTVTVGIVSAKGRVIGAGPFDNFIQTDASINPGNSGGPLLNLEGEVVGINTAIVATGQGIGFAVPSNMAKDIITQLRENKQVKRGWLGVSIQDVDESMAKALGLDRPRGALVAQAMQGEPAARAGMKAGDVIMSVNGQQVEDTRELLRLVARLDPGDTATVTVWRQGDVKRLRITVGRRDSTRTARSREAQPEDSAPANTRLGMSLKPVNPQEARSLGMKKPQGLLVTEVRPGSPAAENDVRPGDVILEANQTSVDSLEAFQEIVRDKAQKVGVLMVLVRRNGQNIFRTIPLDH